MRVCALLLGLAAGVAAPLALRGQQVGEFQVGDRIQLRVEGESLLTDTFTVAPGPVLPLPVIGDVPLTGVRRAELRDYLTRFLSRFIKDPVVHVQSLLRLSIVGEVEQPGFYPMPGDLVLSDAIMRAGGPTREADLKKLRIERGDQSLWESEVLQQAIAQGRTLDQLNLRVGDRVVVPRARRFDTERTVRIIGILLTIPVAIYGVTRIF